MNIKIKKGRLYFDIEYNSFCTLYHTDRNCYTNYELMYTMTGVSSGVRYTISRSDVIKGRLIDLTENVNEIIWRGCKLKGFKTLYGK